MRAALAAALALALLAGCGGDGPGAGAPGGADRRAGATEPQRAEPRPHRPRLRPSRCPRRADNCRAARGRVLYVERVDPDGDGDAHLVLGSRDSITGPGLTAVDIERERRPHPLPRIGDEVSAAGPVYRGSFGQRQIQAVELHVARR